MVPVNQTCSSFIAGIAGGSASGKSTFTSALARCFGGENPPLSIKVISTDDYFLPNETMPHFQSVAAGQELPDYNRPDSIDCARLVSDLKTLSQAEDRPDVILLEGLMVLHLPEVRERLDLRLFIELDAEERALRRLVRNLKQRGDPLPNHEPSTIAAYYLESARVGYWRYIEPSRAYADFILRGDGDFERTAALVAAMIRARLGCSCA